MGDIYELTGDDLRTLLTILEEDNEVGAVHTVHVAL